MTFKEEMIPKKYFTTTQVARKLNFTNRHVVTLIKNDSFPNAFKHSNRWHIPKEEFEVFKKQERIKLEKTKDCMDVNTTAKFLNLSMKNTMYLVRNGTLSNTFKFNNSWWIPKTEVKAYKDQLKKTSNSMDIDKTAKFLNIPIHRVKFLIKNATFSNAFKHNKRWHIPKEDVEAIKEQEEIKLEKTKDCMDVNSTAKFLSRSMKNTMYLISNGTFSNAFKSQGKWWIPIADIEVYKEQVKITYSSLDIGNTAKNLNISSQSVRYLISNGTFPNAFRFQRKWWIPIADIEVYKEQVKITCSSMDINNAAIFLSLPSHSVSYLIRNGTFSNAFKQNNKWYIPKEDVDAFKEQEEIKLEKTKSFMDVKSTAKILNIPNNPVKSFIKNGAFSNALKKQEEIKLEETKDCMDVKSTANFLSLPSPSVSHLIRNGTFSNAFKHNNRWYIPKKDVEAIKEQEEINLEKTKDCMDVNSTAKFLNIPIHRVKSFIINGTFSNAFKHNKRWYIPKKNVEAIKEQEELKLEKTKDCIDVNNAAKILNIPIYRVRLLINNGTFSNAVKFNNFWWIHKTEVKTYKEHLKKASNFMNMHNTAKFLNIPIHRVKPLIKNGTFSNAFKYNKRWHIPKEEIEAFKKQEIRKLEKTKDCMDVKSTAKFLNIPINRVKYLIKSDAFSDAFRHNKRWYISKEDVDAFKEQEKIKLKKMKDCMDIKSTAKFLNIPINRVRFLIKNGSFFNAFKFQEKWWIPIADIEALQEQKILKFYPSINCMDVSNTAKHLNLSLKTVRDLIENGTFSNIVKYKGKKWISLKDIKEFEVNETKLSIEKVTEMLNLNSVNTIIYLIKQGVFSNARKNLSNEWCIPQKDLTDNNNTLTVEQVAVLLNYESSQGVLNLINHDIFPNIMKDGRLWLIPFTDVKKIIDIYKSSFSTEQVRIRFNYQDRSYIAELIRKNHFPNSFKFLDEWRLTLEDIEDFEKNYFPDASNSNSSKTKGTFENIENYGDKIDAIGKSNYISVKKASEILSLSKSAIYNYIHSGKFPHTTMARRKWWIHESDIQQFQNDQTNNIVNSQTVEAVPINEDPYLQDYLNINDLMTKLRCNRFRILKLINNELSDGAIKYRGKHWVSRSTLKEYLVKKDTSYEEIRDCFTAKETAVKLGYKSPGSIWQLLKGEHFPNAFQLGVKWYIPSKDIDKFIRKKEKARRKIDYTPAKAYKELENYIMELKISTSLTETRSLYKKFCHYKINNSKGSTLHLRNTTVLYKNLYKKFVVNIKKEIFLLSTDEITNILQTDTLFTKTQKKNFIIFLRYVYHQKGIVPETEFSLVSDNVTNNDKKIYSTEEFNKVYRYVKDTEYHMQIALENRNYTNMWAYTILLLTDFIRGQDVILQTPNLNLDDLNIIDLDYFRNNILTEEQIEGVIKQLYLSFRNKRSSKTNELLTFIVSPGLKEPLAYSLVISEIHRRNQNSKFILDTFIQGKYRKVRTEGKISHNHFFDKLNEDITFHFSSRKLNNSVATYLFYSITETDGQDSDLALHLTQIARSHKRADSTSRYIQATNKDGTINRVSYNIFKRGHFGWLFNYLIIYANHFDKIQNDLEERTKLIEELRNDFSPRLLENIAEFSLPKNLSKKDSNQTMEQFIQEIYNRRINLVSKLQNYTKNEIHEILYKLSKGDLPSKNEHAQCLISPDCINPQLKNCFTCEYVVPGNLILIQLNDEMQRLITNINKENNNILLTRDTKFLLHALLVWKEARLTFGDDKVNSYIPLKEMWGNINKISHKLVLE